MIVKTMSSPRIWASLDPFYESGAMLGRIQANTSFLDALLALDPFDSYRFYLPARDACQDMAARLAERWPSLWRAGRLHVQGREALPNALSGTEHYVFHLSDCIVSPGYLAALRNAFSRQIFPITATTHSLSYARYGADFLKHMHPGATARDAVVATSRAAVDAVCAYYRTLREGYGLDPALFPAPSAEHIPLGVDLSAYAPADAQTRSAARESLGFGDETVFLVLARLCHSSKMDFLPILRAFQRLPGLGLRTGSVRLVLAGWSDEGEWGKTILTDLARNVGLPFTVAERPSHEEKIRLYAASDVFLSPSDNVQETFGLTLLEAQAMGLPVIASDFDGYRDLVEDGRTGRLIPTLGPSVTDRIDLTAPLTFDTVTHLHLAQRLAVDVAAMALAVRDLAGDAALRAAMGQAARLRAMEFSWEQCARKHVALWEELWRRDAGQPARARHPGSVAYAEVFAGYASSRLEPGMLLRTSRVGHAVYRGQDHPIVHEGMTGTVSLDIVRALLVLARKPRRCEALWEALLPMVPDKDIETAQAHLLWCLKHDLLEKA